VIKTGEILARIFALRPAVSRVSQLGNISSLISHEDDRSTWIYLTQCLRDGSGGEIDYCCGDISCCAASTGIMSYSIAAGYLADYRTTGVTSFGTVLDSVVTVSIIQSGSAGAGGVTTVTGPPESSNSGISTTTLTIHDFNHGC
jgi:hypothetical protein